MAWNALQDDTVRLGAFHRTKNFMGVIGKRMQPSGFSEILKAVHLRLKEFSMLVIITVGELRMLVRVLK